MEEFRYSETCFQRAVSCPVLLVISGTSITCTRSCKYSRICILQPFWRSHHCYIVFSVLFVPVLGDELYHRCDHRGISLRVQPPGPTTRERYRCAQGLPRAGRLRLLARDTSRRKDDVRGVYLRHCCLYYIRGRLEGVTACWCQQKVTSSM